MPGEDTRGPLEALGEGLDPREGRTIEERVGPLLALALWGALLIVLLFDLIPLGNRDLAWTVWGTLGTVTGVYGRHRGKI